MERIFRKFRRHSPVEEIIEEYVKGAPERDAAPEATVPEGYKFIRIDQPDGAQITVRRKLATWEANRQRDTLASNSGRRSPTESSRTIITRSYDGRLVRVSRPVRDSTPPLIASTCSSRSESASRSASLLASSVCSGPCQRDTMKSTMTIVDAALAEQRSHGQRRHSRKDGSAATTGSTAAISGTSGDIQIGHIEEDNAHDYTSQYSASDCEEENNNCRSDEGEDLDFVARDPNRSSEFTYSQA